MSGIFFHGRVLSIFPIVHDGVHDGSVKLHVPQQYLSLMVFIARKKLFLTSNPFGKPGQSIGLDDFADTVEDFIWISSNVYVAV